ncbi:hypothetical protein HJC23_003061 [Cyclotella cryptica]|uniref:Uncharacterized protein n=1 Tax=Cyclotella cryptica TaxID=29204 RepID=A0ABD3PYM1_9STRA
MKNDEVNARPVIEVWLSSLWSKQTSQAFKRAVRELLETSIDLHRQVKLILKYWDKSVAKSREAALLFQFKGAARVADATAMMNCCALEKETDRVDYIRYFIKKALYEDESTVVGSVIMKNENEQIGVKQIFESCVEAVPYSVHCDLSSTFAAGESFMGKMRRYFETSMEKFMTHVRNGSLVFTPKYGVLSPDNHSMIQEIKTLDPYLIHWSNVIDYIHPKKFHIIAREISGSDIVHVAHSCNWTSLVTGTDIYDINPAMRLYFYSSGLMSTEMFTSVSDGIIAQAPTHFRNTCTVILARKYIKKFFCYFFENEGVNCGCVNGNTPLTAPFPFLRSVHIAHFMFAYKSTHIKFDMDTYDFLNDHDV